MVNGVEKGYSKTLQISGVGYRASMQGKSLNLTLGYSHPITVEPPAGITFSVEGTQTVKIEGIDKQLVGQVAANVRGLRGPEPYKGKGIKYDTEAIRRKVGKAGAK
jgi:large subunit ribosomal protein L6